MRSVWKEQQSSCTIKCTFKAENIILFFIPNNLLLQWSALKYQIINSWRSTSATCELVIQLLVSLEIRCVLQHHIGSCKNILFSLKTCPNATLKPGCLTALTSNQAFEAHCKSRLTCRCDLLPLSAACDVPYIAPIPAGSGLLCSQCVWEVTMHQPWLHLVTWNSSDPSGGQGG